MKNLFFHIDDETPSKSFPQGRTIITPSPWGEGWDGRSRLIFRGMTQYELFQQALCG